MGMKYCDGDDHLSFAAVAEQRDKQLADVLKKGIYWKALSYKIDDEEPTAAAVISAALNRPQTLALNSTGLTAVADLKGKIMTQMSMHVGERVREESAGEPSAIGPAEQAGYSPADVAHPDSPQMHWHYHKIGGFYRTYDKDPDFYIPEGEPDPFDRLLWPGSFEDERDQFSPRSSDHHHSPSSHHSSDSNDIWGSGRALLWRDADGRLWNDMCLVGELIDEPPDSDDEPYYWEVDSDFDVPDSDGEYFGR